ncbi:TPA: J domain-containing protein [Legionella pneumophila]|nr:J domain-containing protein [Legionella pneumophila]HAU0151362.1 J domain-containing protein [Legionella pneumophila]
MSIFYIFSNQLTDINNPQIQNIKKGRIFDSEHKMNEFRYAIASYDSDNKGWVLFKVEYPDESALEHALNTGKEVDLSYLTFNNIEFSIASLFATTPFKSLQAEEKEGTSNREEASIKKTLAEIERLENQINETHAQFIKDNIENNEVFNFFKDKSYIFEAAMQNYDVAKVFMSSSEVMSLLCPKQAIAVLFKHRANIGQQFSLFDADNPRFISKDNPTIIEGLKSDSFEAARFINSRLGALLSPLEFAKILLTHRDNSSFFIQTLARHEYAFSEESLKDPQVKEIYQQLLIKATDPVNARAYKKYFIKHPAHIQLLFNFLMATENANAAIAFMNSYENMSLFSVKQVTDLLLNHRAHLKLQNVPPFTPHNPQLIALDNPMLINALKNDPGIAIQFINSRLINLFTPLTAAKIMLAHKDNDRFYHQTRPRHASLFTSENLNDPRIKEIYNQYFHNRNQRKNRFFAQQPQVNEAEEYFRFANRDEIKFNPYKVLGVNEDASLEEIKKAYKKLAIAWHPDRVQAGENIEARTERFKKLGVAYNILIDPAKRQEYDNRPQNRFGRHNPMQ